MNECSKIGRTSRRLVTGLAAFVVLACGDALCAQSSTPTVAATLQDPVVEAGEATQYQITVVNGRADSPPPAPVLAGLTFQYVGEENHRSFFFDSRTGGREISSLVYSYTVRPARPGRYVIPGQEVMVGGTALRTLPIAFTVQDDGAADGGGTPPSRTVSSELIVPKRNAYVGESIPVEVRSYFGTEVRRRPDSDVILAGDGFSVQKFTPPQSSEQVVDGNHFNVVFYKSAITGLKIGNLTVGPAETNPVVQLPAVQRRRRQYNNGYSPFDSFFGGGTPMQSPTQIKMHTEAVTLEVRPLPPGKPADFSGGIGQFKLDVEAEPRHAQAGDPVTVRLLLSGQGNFDRVNPPVLADERGLKVYPPSAKFKADDEVGLSGVKTFEQVVIADSARVPRCPPYRFNYLDPATGKYMSLDTPPVAVRIEGGNVSPAPSAAQVPAAAATPTAATPTPARAAEDILYIRGDPGAVRDRADFLPVYQRRRFWLAQGVPLAALLLAAAGLAWRARAQNETARGQARRLREQAELQAALRKEGTTRRDFYLAAARLARLRAARGPAESPLSGLEISQARQLDPPTADAVQEILQRHDELAYSGGQFALEPVPADERRGVLATLETLGKNGR